MIFASEHGIVILFDLLQLCKYENNSLLLCKLFIDHFYLIYKILI